MNGKYRSRKELLLEVESLRKRVSEMELSLEQCKHCKGDQLIQSFLNATFDSVIVVDTHGIMLELNEAFCRKIGKTAAELMGQCIFDFIPSHVAEPRKKYHAETISSGKPVCFEDERNGLYLDNTIYPILNHCGNVEKLLIISRDVTKRKKAEAALKVREMQQEVIAEIGRRAIAQRDLSSIMKDVAKMIFKNLKVDSCAVYELVPDGSALMLQALKSSQCIPINETDIERIKLDKINSLPKHVIDTGEMVEILNSYNEKVFDTAYLMEHNIKSIVAVPLKAQQHSYGLLGLCNSEYREFTRQDINFCEAIAHILAAAIERKRVEDTLQISEMHYRAIVEDQTELICRILPNKMITYANDALCRNFGKTREELIGYNLENFIPPSMQKELDNYLLTFNRKNQVSTVEYKHILPQGVDAWMQWTTRAIFNKRGRAVEFQSVGRNITQVKQTEEVLRESEERYRRLVELLPDAIFVEYEKKLIYANTAFMKLVGETNLQDLSDKSILDIIHPQYRNTFGERIQSIQEKKESSPLVEEKFMRLDGTTVDIEVAGTPFPCNGKMGTLIVARDITSRKKDEEMRKRMEENNKLLNEKIEYDKLKTEFFSNLSHEFKTPLNVLFSTLQLLGLYLKDIPLNQSSSKVNKYMNIMKQNCYRLLRLVNNIIDISRIDSNFFDINLHNYNIVSLLREVTLSVAEYIEDKGLTLQFNSFIEEKNIACDPNKIERIILNLLSNAVKFTKPGGKITVSIYQKNRNVVISVKDTGIGIPDDKLNLIFERFRQVDKSLTRNHEGSGIGLSIVKSLAEMHGGRVWVKSKYGKGSEFIVELPARTIPEGEYMLDINRSVGQGQIERINIEFSDIYL